jgi:hypothetical protein
MTEFAMFVVMTLCLVACVGVFVGGSIFAQSWLVEIKELRAQICRMEVKLAEMQMQQVKAEDSRMTSTVVVGESVNENKK